MRDFDGGGVQHVHPTHPSGQTSPNFFFGSLVRDFGGRLFCSGFFGQGFRQGEIWDEGFLGEILAVANSGRGS